MARGSATPVAVDYLTGFGNGALEGLNLVLATHWHDDHIRGLTSLLRHAPNAKFGCSSALKHQEFLTLVESAKAGTQGRSGVEEFASILDLLLERRDPDQPKELVSPVWAIENRLLLNLPANSRSFPARVTALSPSDGTVKLALAEIAKLIPQPGADQRRIVDRSPNHASVVLWVEAGEIRILLGADLEHTGRVGEGWFAVLASGLDSGRAELFKVPHHGSANGECEQVWTEMLEPDPLTVVTPFLGGVRLPKETDLKRLQQRTSKLFCTSAGAGKPPQRDLVVEKKAREIAEERRVISGLPGQVRVRWSFTEPGKPVIELFNGAYQVR